MKNILDQDEYYSDSEQDIYDSGHRDGFMSGAAFVFVVSVIILLIDFYLLHN